MASILNQVEEPALLLPAAACDGGRLDVLVDAPHPQLDHLFFSQACMAARFVNRESDRGANSLLLPVVGR